MSEASGNPSPRRRFFRQALSGLFQSLEDAVEWQQDLLHGIQGSLHTARPSRPPARVRLRPPGAIDEALFVGQCERSGECVTACPVQAIQVLHSADPAQNGTPYIVAQERACVVCDDLSCMKACPSGALTLVPREDIHMGLAMVEEAVCRRTFGDECTECVDRCPLGEAALRIDDHGVLQVVEAGCTGCGVCEYYCPTQPRAIRIVPA